MPPGRVIQDSDDEEDALSDVATSIDPLQEQSQQSVPQYGNVEVDNEEPLRDDEIRPTEPVVTGSQLGVNFDDFLRSQSQVMGESGISSSQQRREERWIPAESGSESVGAMMNEISRAQRRLVDDATPFDYPRLPSTDPLAESMLYTYQSSNGVNGVKRSQPMADIADGEDNDTGYCSEQQAKRSKISEGYNGGEEPVELPQDGYEDGQQDLPQHAAAIDKQPHGDGPHNLGERFITNDNEASAATSYNYFESSLKLREYTEVSTIPIATPAEERGELVETIRRTPGRSKSMHVPLDSPHDTEPFSSIISSHIKRAKSDMPVRGISPKASIDAPDELSLPVTVEAPVTQKKKRGRKKKQVVEDGTDDEIDELNADDETYGMPSEPKKRGRGRPKKVQTEGVESPKPRYDHDFVMAVPQDTISDPAQVNKAEEDLKFIPWKDELDHDPLNHLEADVRLPQEQYIPRPSRSRAQPIENYESPDSISGFPKETKKRKIKRGKTTSVIIKKSYESDVEDDVIWIDEKPAYATFKAKEKIPVPQIPETIGVNDSEDREGYEAKEIRPMDAIGDKQESNSLPIDPITLQVNEPSGPKKRGRKRKKTAEPVIADSPAQEPIDTEANQSTALQDVPNNVVPPLTEDDTPAPHISTPKKAAAEPQSEEQACTPKTTTTKGPDRHSPITSTSKIPFRVGLSRRARIAPLLKVVRK